MSKKQSTKIDFADPAITIVKKPHSPQCEGPDMVGRQFVWRDKVGRNNDSGTTTRFIQYCCLGVKGIAFCTAEVLVAANGAIAAALNEVSK